MFLLLYLGFGLNYSGIFLLLSWNNFRQEVYGLTQCDPLWLLESFLLPIYFSIVGYGLLFLNSFCALQIRNCCQDIFLEDLLFLIYCASPSKGIALIAVK